MISFQIQNLKLLIFCTNDLEFMVNLDNIPCDMVKRELQVTSYDFQVTSYELRVENLEARVEIRKCEFKYTSYNFKSTNH